VVRLSSLSQDSSAFQRFTGSTLTCKTFSSALPVSPAPKDAEIVTSLVLLVAGLDSADRNIEKSYGRSSTSTDSPLLCPT
jgi:hypothetical protein